MILNDVQAALDAIDEHTYYGTAALHPKDKPWDYIVFLRDVLKRSANKSGYTDEIIVEIVREEFIPDGLPEKVIGALESLAGVRLIEGRNEYWYAVKPSTQLTVEKLTLHFSHSRKS